MKNVFLKSTVIHSVPQGKTFGELDKELKNRPDVISSKLHICSSGLDAMVSSDSENYGKLYDHVEKLRLYLENQRSNYAKLALKEIIAMEEILEIAQ